MGHFRIHAYDVLDSTQIEARKPGYHPGDVITTKSQTAGYGRRGRAWQESTGNLYVTLIEDYRGTGDLSWLGYAVALGLYDAVADLLADDRRLQVKWPNDLLIDGRKLSGILLEIEDDRALIGVGVNIAHAPQTDQPVAALNDHAKQAVTAQAVLERFLPAYQHWHDTGRKDGFAGMRQTWLARAAFVGEIIQARLANGNVLTGFFNDIDENGALVLSNEKAQYSVTSADIYLTKENE